MGKVTAAASPVSFWVLLGPVLWLTVAGGLAREVYAQSTPRAHATTPAQSAAPSCFLDAMKNGDRVTVRGELIPSPHDRVLQVPGCLEQMVIEFDPQFSKGFDAAPAATFSQLPKPIEGPVPPGQARHPSAENHPAERPHADQAKLDQTKLDHAKLDAAREQFWKYATATWPSLPDEPCRECAMYSITATFTGRLDVATLPTGARSQLDHGYAVNARGKILGSVGYGHPMPFSLYRIVVDSVADLAARKLTDPLKPYR